MNKKSNTIYVLTLISASVALFTLCAWICIPFIVCITLQLFALFLISGLFSPKISVSATVLYILLGIAGVPVFSSFSGGISALAGPSGGFIISFIPTAFLISFFNFKSNSILKYIISMCMTLVLSYIIGCLWYMYVFGYQSQISFWNALCICVFPFIIFDAIKILLAVLVRQKLLPYINRLSI